MKLRALREQRPQQPAVLAMHSCHRMQRRSLRRLACVGGALELSHPALHLQSVTPPMQKMKKRAASHAASSAAAPRTATVAHTHVFLPDETYDAATDTWTKRCACGFEVEYERI